MLINYNMDIIEEEYISPHTPAPAAEALPLVLESAARYCYGPEYFTERQGMNTYLLLYDHEGEGIIQGPDGCYTVRPGTAALLDGQRYHLYRTSEIGIWKISWLHFHGQCAAAYHRCITEMGERGIPLSSPARFLDRMERIRLLMEEGGELRDLQICRELIELLTMMAEERMRKTNRPLSEAVREAQALMQTCFREPLPLEKLAASVHLSPYHFIRLFREQTGLTPHRYLILLRIRFAQKQLLSTGELVERIALQAGFSDVNGFIRCFRQVVGMTPLQYRKRNVY